MLLAVLLQKYPILPAFLYTFSHGKQCASLDVPSSAIDTRRTGQQCSNDPHWHEDVSNGPSSGYARPSVWIGGRSHLTDHSVCLDWFLTSLQGGGGEKEPLINYHEHKTIYSFSWKWFRGWADRNTKRKVCRSEKSASFGAKKKSRGPCMCIESELEL